MKKKYLVIIASILAFTIFTYSSHAINVISVASGAWSNGANWSSGSMPAANDNVTIISGNTITIDVAANCKNLTVSASASLLCTTAVNFTCTGIVTNDGTFNLTNGTTILSGASITGLAGLTFYNLTLPIGSGNLTANTVAAPITVGNVLTVNSGATFIFGTNTLNVTGSSSNNGTITVSSGTLAFSNSLTNTGTITCAGASGTVSATGLTNSGTITGAGATISIAGPVNNSGTIAYTNGTLTLTTASGDLTNTGTGIISYTGAGALNISDNFINNGTFTPGNSTITFNGSNNQTISGIATTFNKLTSNPTAANDTIFLNVPITLNSNFLISNGVFDCLANQITGTAGTMKMSASTVLLLGSLTVATAVNFPTAYVAANITLNSTSTVVYQANTNQTISATPTYGNLTITAGTATTTNTLSANTTVAGNLLIQNGTGVVTLAPGALGLTVNGNFTDNGVFTAGTGLVTLNGSSGVQAISSTEAGGLTFYDLTFTNTSATYPGLTTTTNLNVTDILTYTTGNLDLKGHIFFTTNAGVAAITDNLTGGTIISSSAGAQFNVTDPDTVITLKLFGTWIGNQTIGVPITATAFDIQFQNFTQYGTASFTKVGNFADQFGGGNGFHGPVTFTATNSTLRWKFGVSTVAPDTFYNATFNANANRSGNDNFILGSNNTETFNGTTTISSTTPGGMYFGRANGAGNANIIFNGPVVCNIGLTGNVVFADAGAGNANSVTFNSTITLNSTATSTGFYYFGNNANSTVTLSATGQFTGAGTIQGHTNTYLENVTQNGTTLTQTINTSGSDGKLLIGGTAKASTSQPNTFNAQCNFTADTAGYIINATFNGGATFTVNHPGAFGYLISNTFNGTFSATVGDILFQNNVFNGITTLRHTSITANSTTNGGNTFNAAAVIINSGSTNLYTGTTTGDVFAGNATFTQNGTGLIFAARINTSTFAGHITVNGTSSSQMSFGSNGGGITINGSGTQVFATGGSAVVPAINNLTMNMTAAGTNILQFNLTPSFTVTGVLAFNSGNTGLINLNTSVMTLGTGSAAPGTITYPAPGTLAGWIYGGSFTRWFSAGATIPLPTGASVSTTGFFPIGSSPALNVFQPFWFAAPGTTIKTANTITLSQTSNADWNTPIVPYNDATWSGGTSVQGVSIATWVVSPNAGLALNVANAADIMFGGFGFVTFITTDVNASYALSTAGTYAAPSQFYGATDIEVERTGLSLLQINNTWHIGTSNTNTSPLPVTLLDFNAVFNNTENDVDLDWSTASEINNKLFTIERSVDGISFDSITSLPGASTSNQTLYYSAIDPNPIPGIDYYRLKQTDNDGNYSYSYIVPVNITSSQVLTLFPNPVTTSNLMLSYYVPTTSAADIRITDLAGQQMTSYTTTMEKGNNTFTIDASKLAGGVYILKAVIGNQTFVRKFVKQ